MRRVGSKIYDVCAGCGDIIQVNKLLFGSMHVCATEEEQKSFARTIQRKAGANRRRLEEMR